MNWVLWILLLVYPLLRADEDEIVDFDEFCSNEDDSNNKCLIEPPKRNLSIKFHLSGFLPDGYLTRAKNTLNQLSNKYGVEFELKEFTSKKDYYHFVKTYLGGNFTDVSFKTTAIWFENPMEYFGDSDDLEVYAKDCYSNKNCKSRSELAEIHERKKAEQKMMENAWTTEAHQGVKCETSTHGVFHMILYRDWNPIVFEKLWKDSLSTGGAGRFEQNKYIEIRLNTPIPKGEKKDSSAIPPSDRGALSTDGNIIRLNLDPEAKTTQDFLSFGYVPEGDLNRLTQRYKETGSFNIEQCKVLPGGMRRVQSILALDKRFD